MSYAGAASIMLYPVGGSPADEGGLIGTKFVVPEVVTAEKFTSAFPRGDSTTTLLPGGVFGVAVGVAVGVLVGVAVGVLVGVAVGVVVGVLVGVAV